MKKKPLLYLALFIVFLLSFSPLTNSAFADSTYIGIWVSPYASPFYHNYNHAQYITDFKAFVDAAQNNGINTIVFDMNTMSYHYQCDAGLAALSYDAERGFTAAEVNEMAEYVRSKEMKVVVAIETMTHLEYSAFSRAYPEYMVNERDWVTTGKPYVARGDFVEHNGNTYQCKITHTSSASKEPGVETDGYWKAEARSTRNPFDTSGQQLIYDMIDELITAFTVSGEKPDAFCIGGDEAYSWLKLQTGVLTYAETYAMAINNVYNHITTYNANMDVMMWGDMLDPAFNGYTYQTADAIDDINTDIIIIDWRYNLSWYRYDFQAGLFPSVKELTNKGFRVITASWQEPEASAALVWTGNMAEADGDTVLGHMYTTWITSLIPQLTYALADPTDSRITNAGISAIGESIDASINLIGATSCADTDTSYGTYPDCNNCNELDGFYGGTEYRDYYYNSATSSVAYYAVDIPLDPVSYWDFDGNAYDRQGVNDGTLTNGASIVTDPARVQVVNFDGSNDYVAVADDDSLDMTNAFTISCWFKVNEEISDFSDRMVLFGKHCTEYELQLYNKGMFLTYSYNNDADSLESGIISFNPEIKEWEIGKWYHTAWVMDGNKEYLYLNGELIGIQTRKIYNGTMPGTNDFNIGRRTGSSYYFNGRMDDVMVFDRVLSPPEVKYLYLTQDMPTPIAYWDFEGNANDRIDNNDGTLAGGAYIDEDIERYNEGVLILDGTNDTVTCGDPVEFRQTGSRTISAWIKPDATSGYRMIAGRYLWGSGLFVLDGKLRGYIKSDGTTEGNSISSTEIITTGEWQHVAMTFDIDADPKVVRLYRNGVEIDYSLQKTMVGNPDNVASRDFTIGVDYNLTRYFFNGKIDNVKLFDFALSPDQIAVQYQLGAALELYDDLFEQKQLEESIRLDVDLDEGSGTTVYDDSAYTHTGNIYGSNWGWVTGMSGSALDIYLNNADAYVSFGTPASLELDGSRSISAWIYPDTSDANYRVVAGKFLWGFSLYIHDGKLKGYVAGTGNEASSHSSTPIINTGVWQHVAMTFDINADPKVVRLYHNGQEVGYSYQTTFDGSPVDRSTMGFTIGADYIPRCFFDGKIDQVKVFDKALTPRQVLYYYLNSDI